MGIKSRIPRCCIGERASNDKGEEPDVGMVCGGDFPTLETSSAVDLLFKQVPDREVRIVNVVNHMKLQSPSKHPHGLSHISRSSLLFIGIPR